MPRPHDEDQPSPPPAPRTPICEHCAKPMRLECVEPNPNYTNLDLWSYRCDCGASMSNSVAHRDRGDRNGGE